MKDLFLNNRNWCRSCTEYVKNQWNTEIKQKWILKQTESQNESQFHTAVMIESIKFNVIK